MPKLILKKGQGGQAACSGTRPYNNGCSLGAEESETYLVTLKNDEKESNPLNNRDLSFKL